MPAVAGLGPLGRPVAHAALPSLLPSLLLARLVGFRHRLPGRHRLPPVLGRLQGPEARASRLGRGLLVEPSLRAGESPRRPAPLASITRWHFPAEGDRAAVTLTWWDGGLKPPRPEELEPDRAFAEGDWLMVIGDKAKMYGHRLIPERKATRVRPAAAGCSIARPAISRSGSTACKGGKPAGSNFADHAAHLAEVVLLGNIAIRTKEKLLWDGENLRFTNSRGGQQADQSALPAGLDV